MGGRGAWNGEKTNSQGGAGLLAIGNGACEMNRL